MIFLERNKGGTGIRPANLFFIELIIVLLFFSFSAAVILQIFAAADKRQDNSDAVEKAVILYMSQLSQKNEAGVFERLSFEFRTDEGQLIPQIICEAYFPDKGGAADE